MKTVFQNVFRAGAGRAALGGTVVAGAATGGSHLMQANEWLTIAGTVLTVAVGLLWLYQGIQTIGNKRLERRKKELELELREAELETSKKQSRLLDEVLEGDEDDGDRD